MSLFDFRRLIELNVSGKYDPRSVLCLADQSQIVVGTFDGRLELYAPSDSEQVRSRIIKETCDSWIHLETFFRKFNLIIWHKFKNDLWFPEIFKIFLLALIGQFNSSKFPNYTSKRIQI